MSDSITIEVDGELDEPEHLRERTRPQWGMPAAVAIVALLVGGLVWTSLVGSGDDDASPPVTTPQVTEPSASSVSPTTATPRPTVTEAPAVPAVPSPDLADPADAASAALSAWGEFAATGDLSVVEPYFAADGPQLEQLRAEAESLDASRGAPSYTVSLADPGVSVDSDRATVEGDVAWRRAGEPDQEYSWAIELRRLDGTWRLWTVRTVGR